MPTDSIELRPVLPGDRPAIIKLLAASLKRDDDPRFEALYGWKHEQNPFGPSFAVVAVDGDEVVGFRSLMRWQYRHDGRMVTAVRAVDTATHPDYQGRGIFTRLTKHALEHLRDEGVGFVFNTPNSQSLPGYLKMGWQTVGRVPITVRLQSALAIPRIARARVPAERWAEPCLSGRPLADVLEDADAITTLLASQPDGNGLRTLRSIPYLRWRYDTMELGYRALVAEGGVSDGLVIFRVRRRGDAREIVLAEMLVPGGDGRQARSMGKLLSSHVSGDYLIRAGAATWPPLDGFIPLPRQGPILTWRSVCETQMPPLAAWDVTMGDIEMF